MTLENMENTDKLEDTERKVCFLDFVLKVMFENIFWLHYMGTVEVLAW